MIQSTNINMTQEEYDKIVNSQLGGYHQQSVITTTTSIPINNPGNQVYWNGGNGYVTIGGTLGWTDEERKELDELRKDRAQRTVAERKAKFKVLPKHIRQGMIDRVEMDAAEAEIVAHQADAMGRELELGGVPLNYPANYGGYQPHLPVERGLTLDDMKQAHADACIEEMLTEKGA